MNNNFACTLCGSHNIKLITSVDTFKILECKKCHIAFTFPPPSLPDYENMDFHSQNEKDNEKKLILKIDLPFDWQKLIETQVSLIKKNFDLNDDILEIGCGEGIFLNELKLQGFKNTSGIEPSRTAAIRAQKRGLNVTNSYFSPEAFKSKYNLVIMSHVFEHIQDPMSFLNQIVQILKPSGSIMFTQTNFKGLIPRYEKARWYAWVPEHHYWHFTLKGLTLLMNKQNFSLNQSAYISLVHPHNFLYKLANKRESLKDQFISIFTTNIKS